MVWPDSSFFSPQCEINFMTNEPIAPYKPPSMPLPYLSSTIQSSRDLQCFRKLSAPKYQMIALEPDLNWSPLLIDSQKFLGLATETNVIASNLEK
ncbi:hypothetical protein F2Q69_00032256 [Brassica cretica]|uniref:Uncharacterized protein n=1 Tax=Brassica cretica TaxID=69181 RepID=A0A8S9S112_BRACR|nr:hypothetical protein F2Q69_00032256 [Brassica cretica]